MSTPKYSLLVAAIIGLVILNGCGGDSSLSLSGKVIDGYIAGATVCLDVNNNYTCDSGDPSTESEPDGSYSLDYSGSLDGLYILAEVGEDATDQDLNVCQDNHVQDSYMLIAPAERSSVITPMTTLVSTEMLKTGKSIDDATQEIQEVYQLSIDPLDYDFKKSQDEDVAEIAKKYVAAIAVVNSALNTSIDVVNTDLSDGEVMMGAILKARENLLPDLIDSSSINSSCGDSEEFVAGVVDSVDVVDINMMLPEGANALVGEVRGLKNQSSGKVTGS